MENINSDKVVVTGAFGYSGQYIARRLLDEGHDVRTLTNSPDRPNPFGDKVNALPYNFDNFDELARSLENVAVLYITYWVRFNHKMFAHATAVQNTKILFRAACEASVKRIVYVSITNPSLDSDLEYFSGKAELEKALVETGIPHSILRPTVLFGKEDILINNIAWLLRRMPAFGVFGDGAYKLQPIYVDDLAELAVSEGKHTGNRVIDAIGPETFTYCELVETINRGIGVKRPIVSVPPWLGYIAGSIMGFVLRDMVITRDEIEGLMRGLLCTDSEPAGETRLTDWVAEHSNELGKHYASELARRRNREKAYGEL